MFRGTSWGPIFLNWSSQVHMRRCFNPTQRTDEVYRYLWKCTDTCGFNDCLAFGHVNNITSLTFMQNFRLAKGKYAIDRHLIPYSKSRSTSVRRNLFSLSLQNLMQGHEAIPQACLNASVRIIRLVRKISTCFSTKINVFFLAFWPGVIFTLYYFIKTFRGSSVGKMLLLLAK